MGRLLSEDPAWNGEYRSSDIVERGILLRCLRNKKGELCEEESLAPWTVSMVIWVKLMKGITWNLVKNIILSSILLGVKLDSWFVRSSLYPSRGLPLTYRLGSITSYGCPGYSQTRSGYHIRTNLLARNRLRTVRSTYVYKLIIEWHQNTLKT